MTVNRTLLLRNGIVLTMDPAIGDLDRGDVLVNDGEIAQVGRDLDVEAEIIDCTGKIVLPGFINSHQHLFQTALRSYWADALEIDYFTQPRTGSNAIFHNYTPDDVYWGYYVGALENLAAGRRWRRRRTRRSRSARGRRRARGRLLRPSVTAPLGTKVTGSCSRR
jgi:5-methylthioadenosine/S-adenosylhomocysteine deaminase